MPFAVDIEGEETVFRGRTGLLPASSTSLVISVMTTIGVDAAWRYVSQGYSNASRVTV